ncbi:sodium:calcium antiporter [Candidatus Gracilibacteria bacterium]|nr:sodium:calcium antiporter [Candidatus Gracilibacteria bacterium]
MVVKGATMATKHASLLAESYRLSKYVVGFIVVAVISILPETLIALSSAVNGVPSFGLGTLFGSNISDLTLVFTILVLVANRSLKVESKILKNHAVYPFFLLLPLILGFDGYFSRLEGVALIVVGMVFYVMALKGGIDNSLSFHNGIGRYKHFLKLLFSMAVLLVGSYFTVSSATTIAGYLGVSPILIGILVVGIGTTMPELFFSIKCVRKADDSLAIGDLLGTVLADATVVVGILALVSPFAFPAKIVYVTGGLMVVASLMLFNFMRSGRSLSKKEAALLFAFWLIFVLVEFLSV